MSQTFDLIMGIIIIFSLVSVGYYIFDGVHKLGQNYKQIEIDINNDIKPNMSQTEIHNIIEVNCQNMVGENNIYYCIDRYESESSQREEK